MNERPLNVESGFFVGKVHVRRPNCEVRLDWQEDSENGVVGTFYIHVIASE